MRQIRFRAKDFLGTWHYGFIVKGNEQAVIIPAHKGGTVEMDINIYVKPETVGQFTGLRDINGKDIYEGDILDVNYADEDSYLEVRFVRGVFAFLWNGDLDDEFPCNAPTHEWAKVIGNIYDDPKLLKRH